MTRFGIILLAVLFASVASAGGLGRGHDRDQCPAEAPPLQNVLIPDSIVVSGLVDVVADVNTHPDPFVLRAEALKAAVELHRGSSENPDRKLDHVLDDADRLVSWLNAR